MAIFENFEKGLIKRYNQILPKTYKVVVNFLFLIDSKTVLDFVNAENGLKNYQIFHK